MCAFVHLLVFPEVGGGIIGYFYFSFLFLSAFTFFYNRYMDDKKAEQNKNSCRMLGITKDFTERPNLWLRKISKSSVKCQSIGAGEVQTETSGHEANDLKTEEMMQRLAQRDVQR